jgi:sulfonate transport system ATP-binding protein
MTALTDTRAVVVEQVVRRFGDRTVLDDLDLTIGPEELVVLLGPSGCGKSTLLRLLAGLDRPDAGRVEVPAQRAVVFQADRLLPWQRVLRNVTLGLRGPDADQRAREVLAEVGLADRESAWPKQLSGGEAQRVALARALVSEPELVLLDEPFAALDAITRLRMHDLLRELRARHQAAMLLVTHDVAEAIALADRVVVMSRGRIGASHEVRLSPAERRTSPAREELRATLLADLGLANQH